jgi:hypothetical protein
MGSAVSGVEHRADGINDGTSIAPPQANSEAVMGRVRTNLVPFPIAKVGSAAGSALGTLILIFFLVAAMAFELNVGPPSARRCIIMTHTGVAD